MQNGTRLAQFDFKIYEELKEIKKEIRQSRAMHNLARLLDDNQEQEEGVNYHHPADQND